MTVITFLQLLLAWGFRISGKENPASLPNKSQANLQKPWKTFCKFKNLHETCETLRKPAETHAKTMETRRNSESLTKPCGNSWKPCENPRKLEENLWKPSGNPSETLRKPFGNPAETQENPHIQPLEIKTIKWRIVATFVFLLCRRAQEVIAVANHSVHKETYWESYVSRENSN